MDTIDMANLPPNIAQTAIVEEMKEQITHLKHELANAHHVNRLLAETSETRDVLRLAEENRDLRAKLDLLTRQNTELQKAGELLQEKWQEATRQLASLQSRES